MYSTSESDPTTAPLTGSKPLLPELITPDALITATFERRRTPVRSHDTDDVVLGVDVVGALQLGHEIVELVFVGDFVDQPDAQRVDRLERPLVDQRPHFRLALAARFGDRLERADRTGCD